MGGDYSWGAWVYAFPAWELEGVSDPPLYVRTIHGKDIFYVVDGEEYYELRRRIGRAISAGGIAPTAK